MSTNEVEKAKGIFMDMRLVKKYSNMKLVTVWKPEGEYLTEIGVACSGVEGRKIEYIGSLERVKRLCEEANEGVSSISEDYLVAKSILYTEQTLEEAILLNNECIQMWWRLLAENKSEQDWEDWRQELEQAKEREIESLYDRWKK